MFTVTLDGTVTNRHHEQDADDVLTALGGTMHPCGEAANAYRVAVDVYNAHVGIADIPGLSFEHKRWSDGHDCGLTCTGKLLHVSSLSHQASRWGIPETHAQTVLDWYAKGHGLPGTQKRRERYLGKVALQTARRHNLPDSVQTDLRNFLITPTFLELALPLQGVLSEGLPNVRPNNILGIVLLRSGGVTLEWLREFMAHLEIDRLEEFRGQQYNFLGNLLLLGRGVGARETAHHFNSGAYATTSPPSPYDP